MMFTCQEQSSSLPFTCNFHYSYYSLRIVVIFVLPFFTYLTAQHKLWTPKERRCVTGRCFNLFTSFVWLYSMLFWHHRNVMAIRLPMLPSCSTRRFWMRVRNRDWCQWVVISFLICVLLQVHVTSFMYIISTCALRSERQYHWSIHLFLQRGSKPMGETSGSLAAIGK